MSGSCSSSTDISSIHFGTSSSLTNSTPANTCSVGNNSTANNSNSSSSSSITNSTSTPSNPSLIGKRQDRYQLVRTLQNSLFGQVQLAYDHSRKRQVAIKVSCTQLVDAHQHRSDLKTNSTTGSESQQPRAQDDSALHVGREQTQRDSLSSQPASTASTAAAAPSSTTKTVQCSASQRNNPCTARSQAGVHVLEDVI